MAQSTDLACRVPTQTRRSAQRTVHLGRLHGPGQRPRCAPCRSAEPEPHRIATAFAQRLVEVLTTQRPLDQLIPQTTYPVSERVKALIHQGLLRPERGRRPALQTVHTSTPDDASPVIEACASVQLPDGRLEMLAFRLELRMDARSRRSWKLTALNARPLPR